MAPRSEVIVQVRREDGNEFMFPALVLWTPLLTLLILFSSNRSAPSGMWITILRKGFGWGMYLLPLTLLVVGLWLILRNFERIPLPSIERLFGLSLLYGLSGATNLSQIAAALKGPHLDPLLAGATKYGYLGVELFFLISGFVILMTAYASIPSSVQGPTPTPRSRRWAGVPSRSSLPPVTGRGERSFRRSTTSSG